MMKNRLCILLVLLLASLVAKAQTDLLEEMNEDSGPEGNVIQKQPILTPEVRSWKLVDEFSRLVPIAIDTTTINFHNYTPIYKRSITNTYLGFLGSPYISNDFFERIDYPEYYFLTSYKGYRKNSRDVSYYNSNTPFSSLKYQQGGEEEQMFTAFLTQNLNEYSNIGFEFDAIKSEGQFKNHEANHRNLNFFYSRKSERHSTYVSLITGSNKSADNGGIVDKTINPFISPFKLLVNLSGGIKNEINSLSLFSSHEYFLEQIPFLKRLKVAEDNEFKAAYSVQYLVGIDNHKRYVKESVVEEMFFDTTYFSNLPNHTDSSLFRRFNHILQFKFLEDSTRKFSFYARAFLENEIVKATHPVAYGVKSYDYSNLFVGGEIADNKNRYLNWKAYARVAIIGRNIGDAQVKGVVSKKFQLLKQDFLISGEAWYRDISPDIYQNYWFDNHFRWSNNFKKQHDVVFKGSLSSEDLKLKLGANYVLMSNFLYNGYSSLPEQYNGEFSVLGAWLKHDLMIGPVIWTNHFIFQETSNATVLHIPKLNYYTSLSVTGTLFKVMKYQIGAEMYYNSAFYADKFEPMTTRFYLQNEVLTGGYPQLNGFVNVKLKRTSAFFQLMHFNSYISGGNYFNSPGYPVNRMAFMFGLFWSFYD
jgi:hypothetical protein